LYFGSLDVLKEVLAPAQVAVAAIPANLPTARLNSRFTRRSVSEAKCFRGEMFSMHGKFEDVAAVVPRQRKSARREAMDLPRSRADRSDTVYLRAAQAYMLISMPTGTSAIFGVFQVIRVSQVARK
jgi:hypothetical protein